MINKLCFSKTYPPSVVCNNRIKFECDWPLHFASLAQQSLLTAAPKLIGPHRKIANQLFLGLLSLHCPRKFLLKLEHWSKDQSDLKSDLDYNLTDRKNRTKINGPKQLKKVHLAKISAVKALYRFCP